MEKVLKKLDSMEVSLGNKLDVIGGLLIAISVTLSVVFSCFVLL